ncbi:MAG: undecaprenyl-diphosphate phosphatase [Candidatus Omnitrophota bacterium]|jgi:undecaprenyl-diphosphatase|nr:undecaprenyl-diphosphate phosphatase [Candidatus Omnitrophota bacterium]
MTFFKAVLSGIVQGITEFLPVSSSGHLVILHKLIGFEGPELAFDLFLHIGTVISIAIVFWRELVDVVTLRNRIGGLIILATLSTAVFVFIFGNRIEVVFTNVKLVGAMLMLTGIWLLLGNYLRFGSEGLSGFKAVVIGLAQGIAALPGISRSGATISTALFLGVDFRSAAKFSFILAVPTIIGAFLVKIKDMSFQGVNIYYFIGLITSCIVGVLSLKLLLRVLYKNKFHVFGVYCILMGILVFLFL